MSGNGNYMVESNIEWRVEKAKELVAYIQKMNKDADEVMAHNPDIWIGKLTDDLDHWKSYGVETVSDLNNYLDACASEDDVFEDSLTNGESI